MYVSQTHGAHCKIVKFVSSLPIRAYVENASSHLI